MSAIGIDGNLDRARIRLLLVVGLIGSVLTGAGDFLLGFGDELPSANLAEDLMASAPNLADWQLVCGGFFGVVGIFMEGIAFFAVYRLMADSAPRMARVFRAGIFGYIWLAPVGCHLNIGVMNFAYKYLLQADPSVASQVAEPMIWWFCAPVYALLCLFWIPMIVVQWRAFAKGFTPYPAYAKWFNLIVGAVPCLVVSALVGFDSALGAGIGTMFLSWGNALMFGGLLATLPSEARFVEFKAQIPSSRTGPAMRFPGEAI